MPRKSKKASTPIQDVETETLGAPRGKVSRKRSAPVNPETDEREHITGSTAEGITRDVIERRAYERYERRGRQDGQHEQDWLDAERELRDGGPPD